MPVGYWWTVAVLSWGVACALTRWRRPGSFSKIPALLVSELPFIVAYLLIASTVLALADGDLDSPGGAAGAAVALLALAGLGVVVRRALVSYAELPGAHHDFDMFESIRSAAVSKAVEQFTAKVSTSAT